jgi:hypothetical protein
MHELHTQWHHFYQEQEFKLHLVADQNMKDNETGKPFNLLQNRDVLQKSLSMQVILRVAFLVATRSFGRVKVAREGFLLTVQKTSIQYTVISYDLPLLTVN